MRPCSRPSLPIKRDHGSAPFPNQPINCVRLPHTCLMNLGPRTGKHYDRVPFPAFPFPAFSKPSLLFLSPALFPFLVLIFFVVLFTAPTPTPSGDRTQGFAQPQIYTPVLFATSLTLSSLLPFYRSMWLCLIYLDNPGCFPHLVSLI